MNDQLITKETAVLGEIKGYPFYTYPNVPTQSLLQRWLREIHNISIEVFSLSYHNKIQFTMNIKKLNKSEIKILSKNNYHFEIYEEALEFGLQKALELL